MEVAQRLDSLSKCRKPRVEILKILYRCIIVLHAIVALKRQRQELGQPQLHIQHQPELHKTLSQRLGKKLKRKRK